MKFFHKENLYGNLIDIRIEDDLCLLNGDSGTGKTYLSGLLKSIAYRLGIRCTYIRGEEPIDTVVAVIKAQSAYGDSILILDDADTCYSTEVLDALNNYPGTKLIIFKYEFNYEKVKHNTMGYYFVDFKDGVLKLSRSKRSVYF